ncbi:MAG TPA: nuclear transport factor 2 family protein, partial [Pyrinomonadaceae bacterium]|nr:nuclear transport factor 2 family protein [Pyrinomonadaceae bacterium]
VISVSSAAFGQTKTAHGPKAEIIALEKAGWEAWKNKNPSWYQANTIAEVVSINSDGVSDKAQMIRYLSGCDVKSFALDNFKFVALGSDAAMMTYTATQDEFALGRRFLRRFVRR